MKTKYRILKRSARLYGTWFAIQRKVLFWWIDLPCVYKTFDDAILDLMEKHSNFGEDIEESIEVGIKV